MWDHTRLRAFALADELVMLIYRMTRDLPKEEMYGLSSQMRRASISVPSNIVEGCARETRAEYLRFLQIAFASLRALHYQFSIAARLEYVKEENLSAYDSRFVETEKVLAALIRSLRKRKQPKALNPKP